MSADKCLGNIRRARTLVNNLIAGNHHFCENVCFYTVQKVNKQEVSIEKRTLSTQNYNTYRNISKQPQNKPPRVSKQHAISEWISIFESIIWANDANKVTRLGIQCISVLNELAKLFWIADKNIHSTKMFVRMFFLKMQSNNFSSLSSWIIVFFEWIDWENDSVTLDDSVALLNSGLN